MNHPISALRRPSLNVSPQAMATSSDAPPGQRLPCSSRFPGIIDYVSGNDGEMEVTNAYVFTASGPGSAYPANAAGFHSGYSVPSYIQALPAPFPPHPIIPPGSPLPETSGRNRYSDVFKEDKTSNVAGAVSIAAAAISIPVISIISLYSSNSAGEIAADIVNCVCSAIAGVSHSAQLADVSKASKRAVEQSNKQLKINNAPLSANESRSYYAGHGLIALISVAPTILRIAGQSKIGLVVGFSVQILSIILTVLRVLVTAYAAGRNRQATYEAETFRAQHFHSNVNPYV